MEKLNLEVGTTLDFGSLNDRVIMFAFLNFKYDCAWNAKEYHISKDLYRDLMCRFAVYYDGTLKTELEKVLSVKIVADESLSGLEITTK